LPKNLSNKTKYDKSNESINIQNKKLNYLDDVPETLDS